MAHKRRTQKKRGGNTTCKPDRFICEYKKADAKLIRERLEKEENKNKIDPKKVYQDCMSCQSGGAGGLTIQNLRTSYAPVSPGQNLSKVPKLERRATMISRFKPNRPIIPDTNNIITTLIPRAVTPIEQGNKSSSVVVIPKPPTRIVKRMVKGALINVEEPVSGGRRRTHRRRRHTSRRR